MVGQTVSHYRILRKLGGGGMGVVYAAEDLQLGRVVALKFLAPALAGHANALARLEREARSASAINHPHICTVHAIEHIDGGPFIVMELLDGVSLRDRLAREPLPLEAALRVAIQVADALEGAHGAGIVHRDVKPGNIFITRRGDAKVLDFGLAKLAEETDHRLIDSRASTAPADACLTEPGRVLGTPGYASPEQTLGLALDCRSDLFSLGVVLYEMTTGHRPFGGETPALVNDAVIHAVPAPIGRWKSDLPADLQAVVGKALEKDPALRYQDAGELRRDLLRLERDLQGARAQGAWTPGPRNLTPSPPVPTPPPVPRPPWRRWAMAAAGLAAAAILVFAVVQWRPSAETSASLPDAVSREVTGGTSIDIEPAVAPDGRTIAYVADRGTAQEIRLADLQGGPGQLWASGPWMYRHPAWAPDGRSLYFESNRDGRPGIYEASRLNSESAVLVVANASEPAASPDGTRLAFVAMGEGGHERIAVMTLGQSPVTRVVTVDAGGRWGHASPTWSPDGGEICYWAWDGLWIVPAEGGAARQLTRDATDLHPAWSPSGFVYFSSLRGGTWQLWRVRASGGQPQRVTMGLGVEQSPALDAAGRVIAFSTATARAQVAIRDVATGRERRLGGEGDQYFPAFGPRGNTVFLMLMAWNRSSIWVQALAGGVPSGAQHPLIAGVDPAAAEIVDSQPACSPDGRFVAFLRKQGDARDIYVVPASGGTPFDVTNHPAADYHPAWSPDGARLAFTSERDGGERVWVQRMLDGRPAGEPYRLTTGDVREQAPAWSIDGAQLAFIVTPGDASEVAVADASRRAVPAVVTSGAHAWRVRWMPDGNLLISGTWSSESLSLRRLDPAGRTYVASWPPLDLGSDQGASCFDVSSDGRYLALVRGRTQGRIGVFEARRGAY